MTGDGTGRPELTHIADGNTNRRVYLHKVKHTYTDDLVTLSWVLNREK